MYKRVIAWGKLLAVVLMALHLSSCDVVEVGELVGTWQDNDATFTTCGDTFALGMGLEIREDSTSLRGTLSMGDTDFPFVGTKSGRIIKGDVEDTRKEVFLVANLAYSGGVLRGKFEAAEERKCAAGGTSKPVYQVTMKRIQGSRENQRNPS